jgi:hypothetical protein
MISQRDRLRHSNSVYESRHYIPKGVLKGTQILASIFKKVIRWRTTISNIKEYFKFDVMVSKRKERMMFQKGTISTFILLVEWLKLRSLLWHSVLQEALNLMSTTNNGPFRYNYVPLVLRSPKKYPSGLFNSWKLLKRHHRFLEEFKSFQIKEVHQRQWPLLSLQSWQIVLQSSNAIEPTFMNDDYQQCIIDGLM